VTSVGGKQKTNGQALAEFEQEWFYQSDLPLFAAKYNLPNISVSTFIGRDNPDHGYLGEATLDVEYIRMLLFDDFSQENWHSVWSVGVAPLVDTWVWYQDSFDILSWAINVTGTPNAPKVHSISYGSGESTYQNSTMTRWNTEFMVQALLLSPKNAQFQHFPLENGICRLFSSGRFWGRWNWQYRNVLVWHIRREFPREFTLGYRGGRNFPHGLPWRTRRKLAWFWRWLLHPIPTTFVPSKSCLKLLKAIKSSFHHLFQRQWPSPPGRQCLRE